jgi:hypothetical protein
MVEKNVFGGKKFYINGPAYPVGTLPKGFPEKVPNVGGYALTYGIPADFWEQWAEQNKLSSFLKPEDDNSEYGAIFAFPDSADTQACAKEHEGYLTGLEPISTNEDAQGRLTDRRLPKPLNNALMKVATEPHPIG